MLRRSAPSAVPLCLFFLVSVSFSLQALVVSNPNEIEVRGLVSFGEDGAAWLRWGSRDILVTPGYMIGKDLRVTAVRHDSVILYRPPLRTYFALSPRTYDLPPKDRTTVIWCAPTPIWAVFRMIALAYRKDYICHYGSTAEVAPKRHIFDMNDMLEKASRPHNRFHGREGVIYGAPVHVDGEGWKKYLARVKRFGTRLLIEWFPVLREKTTLISDGQDLGNVLQNISWKTHIPIRWTAPVKIPLYCSFKERSWSFILQHIVLFNGLGIAPSREGLTITANPEF